MNGGSIPSPRILVRKVLDMNEHDPGDEDTLAWREGDMIPLHYIPSNASSETLRTQIGIREHLLRETGGSLHGDLLKEEIESLRGRLLAGIPDPS